MELLSFRLCFLSQLAGSALMVVESILSEAVECEGGDGTLKARRGAPDATVPHRRRFREVATPPPSRPLTQRPQKLKRISPLLARARRGRVTLVYSAHDTEHNNAVALKRFLDHKIRSKKAA